MESQRSAQSERFDRLLPNKVWNREHLEQLFLLDDRSWIMKIKPIIEDKDYWVWDHTKIREFSVKSAYCLVSKENFKDLIHSSSMQTSINGITKHIWTLKTIPNIKAFIWRVCSDALPVADLI